MYVCVLNSAHLSVPSFAVPLKNVFGERGPRRDALTTDQLGEHKSASPFINPDGECVRVPCAGSWLACLLTPRTSHPAEFVVKERPKTTESSRFNDWRKPGSRVTKPPGGESSMSQIFG